MATSSVFVVNCKDGRCNNIDEVRLLRGTPENPARTFTLEKDEEVICSLKPLLLIKTFVTRLLRYVGTKGCGLMEGASATTGSWSCEFQHINPTQGLSVSLLP
ncbi:hypothetical protein Bca52824_015542 [Brassica carinata]|uniref:Uncharacterized protein n=1 Tax=Brassica carinata TaxID=52824 RepID=A0A8X8B399_BRACI|nr:hypothetical protein Bca52824_015542 [Brassica carinata]